MSSRNERPRRGQSAKAAADGKAGEQAGRFDLYQRVTDQIVELLEKGTAPWRSPVIGSEIGSPVSMTTGKPYRGVNVFLLGMAAMAGGYASRYWMTYRQAAERGGQVRRGERSSMAVFWKLYETEDRKTGDPTKVPVLRYYNVFNADQVDGVEVPDVGRHQGEREHEPLAACEAIVGGFAGGPGVETGGHVPAYIPSRDAVRLPAAGRFTSGELYYAAAFHELGHATGHPNRLARWTREDGPHPLGSVGYGKEELVAEMAAAFLCGEAGIGPATVEDSASYLAGWIKVLKGDKRLVVTAAAQAQKATDLILGRTFENEDHNAGKRPEQSRPAGLARHVPPAPAAWPARRRAA